MGSAQDRQGCWLTWATALTGAWGVGAVTRTPSLMVWAEAAVEGNPDDE
ncbi:hypothetical protein GFS31_03170 [Leptolyngbya sp. BL0902]|nr:hypothetical protein GFS31_03170 [Leptolyngbya sp. BL0902]